MTATRCTQSTDLELLDALHAGDKDAYGELWRRYEGWAHHVARQTTTRFDAEDIVAEAFARILRTVEGGKGPRTAFASYLVTTIRSVSKDWARKEERVTTVRLDDYELASEPVVDGTDLGDLDPAFRSLPLRYRQALWLNVVEGLPARQTAAIFKITSGAAAQLAFRAREALRQAAAGVPAGAMAAA